MYINSNLTPREVAHLHGSLPEDMALNVIDVAEWAEENTPKIDELIGSATDYVTEESECLESILTPLREMLTAGGDLEALQELIETVETLQDELDESHSTVRDSLKQIENILLAREF